MLTFSVLLLAVFASAQGRAVNISNTWVLPEEGFPVFYRYFRDRISWYEADAVCQFHHANLVTVDTTAQYDAVRAYLKELDISSAVWVGLIRSNPDGDFTWTDYRGLSGDGYWSAAPDARAAPLCAAADPAADYRWEARACGGPTVASFICELPVPQWALGNEGCMVKALPALTILYLPESAAVQLTADCGLAGVKRVQCTGNVKRENLLKDLSCNEEEDTTTIPVIATEGNSTNYNMDVASTVTDVDVTSEQTTEADITTKPTSITSTVAATNASPASVIRETISVKKQVFANKVNNIYAQKDNINLDLLHNNNLQSNDIPKLASSENFLSLEQSEKLEDEKHMHHKMLHDELARHGNFETIFTQPTDHFVPPLVMAKAKISDDMTVLSLAEKHAQQLAEQQKSVKHNFLNKENHINSTVKPKEQDHKIEIIDKPLVITLQPNILKDSFKKDNVKSGSPKKYKEKYNDPKAKNLKIDGKLLKLEKPTEKYSTPLDTTTKLPQLSTIKTPEFQSDDGSLELTVELKEPEVKDIQLSDDISKLENIAITAETIITTEKNAIHPVTKNYNQTDFSYKKTTEQLMIQTTNNPIDRNTEITNKQENVTSTEMSSTEKPTTQFPIQTDAIMKDLVINHEVIKITIVDDLDKTNLTRSIYEATTLAPLFKDKMTDDNKPRQPVATEQTTIFVEEKYKTSTSFPNTNNNLTQSEIIPTTVSSNTMNTEIISKLHGEVKHDSTKLTSTTERNIETTTPVVTESNKSEENNSDHSIATNSSTTDKKNVEIVNITEIYEIDSEKNTTDPDAIDDYNSPLLSAANEPLHRPNRSRRPQPPNRLTKFNPFRILG